MLNHLRQLGRAKELTYLLTWRDIRVRYKQSVMGFLWAILMPTLIVGAGIMVRVGAAQWTGAPITIDDVASVVVRAVAWAFFISSLRFGTNSLLSNGNLVTRIAFPKEVFPIAAVLSSLFDFLIAAGAVFVVLLAMGWLPTIHALWTFPLLVLLVALTVGLCLILSAANLFFRDVKYLVEIFLTYAIFFTPVLYEARLAGKWEYLLMLNPVSPILEGLAAALVLHQQPDMMWLAYSSGFAALALVGGYWFFKQLETRFAESF